MPASNAFYAFVAKPTLNVPTIALLSASVSIGISTTTSTRSSATAIAWTDHLIALQIITMDTDLLWIYATQGIHTQIVGRHG
jgi:hypothetical protein